MSKKYPGYNENDTFWDEHHRKNGQMTNNEFFSSNAKGGSGEVGCRALRNSEENKIIKQWKIN